MACSIEYYQVAQQFGRGLSVLQCGITTCESLHRCGPVNYPGYAIHFILKGKCRYLVGDYEYDLEEKDGFVMLPGMINTYIADEREPCTFLYVIFNGEEAHGLMQKIGIDGHSLTFSYPTDEGFAAQLFEMHIACRTAVSNGIDIIGRFLQVMSASFLLPCGSVKETTPKQYISRALDFIEEHYPYHLTTVDVARHVGLERSYLFRLFKEERGISIGEYIISLRLQKAVELLRQRELPLDVIALSVGFCDVSHFTKRFRAEYQTTPGEYRSRMSGK